MCLSCKYTTTHAFDKAIMLQAVIIPDAQVTLVDTIVFFQSSLLDPLMNVTSPDTARGRNILFSPTWLIKA